MTAIDIIITGAITGIGAGLGTTIGSYFSNKLVIKHLDEISKKIKNKKEVKRK